MKKTTKLLFVCSSNLDRSPLAESLFANTERYEAKSCGIFPHANTVISKEAILWADIIFCMQDVHRDFIVQNFPEESAKGKKITVLDISNTYCRYDPELLSIMKEKLQMRLGVRFV